MVRNIRHNNRCGFRKIILFKQNKKKIKTLDINDKSVKLQIVNGLYKSTSGIQQDKKDLEISRRVIIEEQLV